MKKVCKIKAKRYFQNNYGLFIDVERYDGKIDIRMGSAMNMVQSVMPKTPVAGRPVCCTFYEDEYGISDEACVEAFEKIYSNYASAYIFYYISDRMGIQPYESSVYDMLAIDDFCEMEITRYKHNYESQIFHLDVEIGRNPKNSNDVWTCIYIMKGSGCQKTLCDTYAYEIPKNKCKEIMKENIEEYVKVYYCEEAYQEYCIPFHEKSSD